MTPTSKLRIESVQEAVVGSLRWHRLAIITSIFQIVMKDVITGRCPSTNTRNDLTLITGKTKLGSGKMTDILGPNGKPLKTKDPTQIGIEEVIAAQLKNKGRGLDLTHNQILTVIIFELDRVKRLSINQSEIIRDQDKIIKGLNNGIGALSTTEDKQQPNENNRDKKPAHTPIRGSVSPINGGQRKPNFP